jgi:hypothetical protein
VVSGSNPAGMYAYLLGGCDYLGPDRDHAETALAVAPGLRDLARANRRFVLGATHRLASLNGIRQFLDLGCGLPFRQAVHELARLPVPEGDPPAVVAYADIDPMVVSHTAAAHGGTDGIAVIEADLLDPPSVLKDPAVADLIDFTEPTAVIFGSSLYCPPARGREVVAEYTAALAPHSAVVVSVASFADLPLALRLESDAREAGSGWRNYTLGQAAGLLDGLRIVHGRVADVSRWPVIPSWEAPVPAAMMAGGAGIVRG